MTMPFVQQNALEWDVPMIRQHMPENDTSTQPVATASSMMFASVWQNSQYVQYKSQVAFVRGAPMGGGDKLDTEPSRADNLASSVGLGQGVFSPNVAGV
jgi:hypothetical protein